MTFKISPVAAWNFSASSRSAKARLTADVAAGLRLGVAFLALLRVAIGKT
jgi:hypothetical protein